jgi:hypothetical protein
LYCTLDEDFKYIINCFQQRLYLRGYQANDIDIFFKEDSLPFRDSLINKLLLPSINNNKDQENNKRKPIIVVQLPNLQSPLNLKDTFRISESLAQHERFKLIYDSADVIVGKKNNRSLGLYLLHHPVDGGISLQRRRETEPLKGTTAL